MNVMILVIGFLISGPMLADTDGRLEHKPITDLTVGEWKLLIRTIVNETLESCVVGAQWRVRPRSNYGSLVMLRRKSTVPDGLQAEQAGDILNQRHIATDQPMKTKPGLSLVPLVSRQRNTLIC